LFDLNVFKLLALGVIGLIIFGPEQLPKMAAQAGQALRDLRRLAERARTDLTENLGPEFADFDFNDLNPRAFVRKHLLDDLGDPVDGDDWAEPAEMLAEPDYDRLDPGELPPYDSEAT